MIAQSNPSKPLAAVGVLGLLGPCFLACSRPGDLFPGSSPGAMGSASTGSANGSASAPSSPTPPRSLLSPPHLPAAYGGDWVRCYAHFRPSDEPEADVAQLGLWCAEPFGYAAWKTSHGAQLDPASLPLRLLLPMVPGRCVRGFVSADSGVKDVDWAIYNPAGRRLAEDRINDRWPMLMPDGAFCPLERGTYRLEVKVRRGKGRVAVAVYRGAARPPKKPR